jgi:subtilase family serine protease
MRPVRHRRAVAIFLAVFAFSVALYAQDQTSPAVDSRITESIDESKLVQLEGQTHPLAREQYDRGIVPDDFPMEHMLLVLKRSPEQEKAFEQLIERLHDPTSSNYHRWLSAEQIQEKFGPSQQDVATVKAWLQSHGLRVNSVYPNGVSIDVSGTAAEVREAFHAEIHYYDVRGVRHIANASAPSIPTALSPVVAGFSSLNDFWPRFSFTFVSNGEVLYDITPQDFATIYNVRPLWTAQKPITGKGQTIAVLAGSDVKQEDWNTFRSAFGLSGFSGTLTQVNPPTPSNQAPSGNNNCVDPGLGNLVLAGAETEAALDVDWSGGVAPDASIVLASCASTTTQFGPFVAANNLINSTNPPPIISVSIAGCEAGQPSSELEFLNGLWQQAVAEGTTVVVGAGDSGPAVCDDFNTEMAAVDGIAVNAAASTPYDVAVGGTDYQTFFQRTQSLYFSNANSPTGGSAKSYIPEMPLNDSCANSLLSLSQGFFNGPAFCNSSKGEAYLTIFAGSGGPSSIYAKPSWQSGVLGIPNDGRRDLPDVSLPASGGGFGVAMIHCMSDTNVGGVPCDYTNPADVLANSNGGTSYAAPAFAGIQALINQKAGGRQGLSTYLLYKLAASEYGSASRPNLFGLFVCDSSLGFFIGGGCIFHDVAAGNDDVPCVAGSPNCYAPKGATYGVVSTSTATLQPAFNATPGWDFATGLGTPNVTNLVNSWPTEPSY